VLLGSSCHAPIELFRRRIIKSLSEQYRHNNYSSFKSRDRFQFVSVVLSYPWNKKMNVGARYLLLVGTLQLCGVDRRHETRPVPCPSVSQSYVLIGSILMCTESSGVNKIWITRRIMVVSWDMYVFRSTASTKVNKIWHNIRTTKGVALTFDVFSDTVSSGMNKICSVKRTRNKDPNVTINVLCNAVVKKVSQR
jgi:hypothetical protein